jgi:hypothetical protein
MITFIIKPDDGAPFRVKADSRDVRLWERINPRNTLRRIAENPNVDDYYSLSHLAIKRQRLREMPPYDDYVDTYAVEALMDTSEVLDYDELLAVVDKTMSAPDVNPSRVADSVVELLDSLRLRSLEPVPTLPGR